MTRVYRGLSPSLAWLGFLPVLVGSVALGDAVKPTPWLAGITASTVYACIEADGTTAATVDYGLSASYGMSATTAGPGGSTQATSGSNYVHNVELNGLIPNTLYHYRVTQGSSVSDDYTFRTAPQAGTAAHWGFAADCRTNTTTHDDIAAQIAQRAPNMMVYGGDLAEVGDYNHWNNEWFVPNQNALNATVPSVNSPGNHEGWNGLTRAFTQSAAGDPNYFSFDYGDSHILVLNYMVSEAEGSAQWNFARDDLAATDKKWKIVVNHAPAYCAGGHGDDAEMVAMTQQIFEPDGVNLVLAGHSHFYQHDLVNGIHHMVIGSFGAPLTTPDTGPYTVYTEETDCFGIIDTTPSTLTLTTYRGDGSTIETITVPEPSALVLLVMAGSVLLASVGRRLNS
jgi:hypothetical protein